MWSGPLPNPEDLAKYEEVHSGAAERIFKMAEIQGDHRRALEKRHQEASIARSSLGVRLGFIVAMSAILGGVIVMLAGEEGWGFAVILGNVATLAVVFVVGRVSQILELRRKSRT